MCSAVVLPHTLVSAFPNQNIGERTRLVAYTPQRLRKKERGGGRQTDRQTDKDRERQREKEGGGRDR